MLNYGDTSECPTLKFETEKEEDLVQKSQIIANLAPSAGAAIPLSYINDTFNIPLPQNGERTLEAQRPESPEGDQFDELEDNEDDAPDKDPLKAGDGKFHGNQHTGPIPSDGGEKAPKRITVRAADQKLTKGFSVTDAKARDIRFGRELKVKLDNNPNGAARKELLNWGKDTVKTGKSAEVTVKGEERTQYGKVYQDSGKRRGFLVIVDTKDGYAFNMYMAKPSQVARKLSAKEGANTEEQPSAGVMQAIAAAGGLPDCFKHTPLPTDVNSTATRLGELMAIKDDAVFARELKALADSLIS
jgi:hypothetical protein